MKNAIVLVGSANPSKIAGCNRALQCLEWTRGVLVQSVRVSSDVPRLPIGEEVCIAGARVRADQCRDLHPHGFLFVGVESGLRLMPLQTLAMTTYAYIQHRDGHFAFAGSSSHPVIEGQDVQLVLNNKINLDQIFPDHLESISVLTKGAYTLADKVFEATICALANLNEKLRHPGSRMDNVV